MSTGEDGGDSQGIPSDRFPEEFHAAFAERARAFTARRDQLVLDQGLETVDVFLIQKGRVKVSLFTPHGRETILREMGPGEIFGELAAIDGQPRSASIIAVDETVLARLSGAEFLTFLREVPEAHLWITRQLSLRVRDLTGKVFELTSLPVNTRLHCELLRLGSERRSGDSAVIDRFPTHSDLAARLGTHREAITRELGFLTKERVVKQQGRRMTILAVGRLETMIRRHAN